MFSSLPWRNFFTRNATQFHRLFGGLISRIDSNPGEVSGLFILSTLCLSSCLVVWDVVLYIFFPTFLKHGVFYLIADISSWGIILMSYQLHRSGNTHLAGMIFLFSLVILTSLAFTPDELQRLQILFTLPIIIASFILTPSSSFLIMGFSAFTYIINCILDGKKGTFNYFNLIAMLAVAVFAWIISTRQRRFVQKLSENEKHLKAKLRLFEKQDSPIQEIINQTIEESITLTRSELGYLVLLNRDELSARQVTWASTDLNFQTVTQPDLMPVKFTELWREAVRGRQAIIDNNGAIFHKLYPEQTSNQPQNHHLITPIFQNERMVAVIGVMNKDQSYEENDATHLTLLGTEMWSLMQRQDMIAQLEQTNKELIEAYEETLSGWARALETRDKATEQHSQRVAEISVQLAKDLGIEESKMIHLRRGVLLHDIGKIAIPDRILQKHGPLTEEEWVVMRQHPLTAYAMLSPIAYLRPAIDIPYYHHERWNGSGYPFGLKGEEIPLTARIFAVVDVWDALTSDRPYRKALPREEVVEYIRAQAGIQFDPRVVKAFLAQVDPPKPVLAETSKQIEVCAALP